MDQPIPLFIKEQGKGVPVIFIHGYPLDHRIWLPTTQYLHTKFHCILPDLGGFGETASLPEQCTMQAYAAEILGMMDKMKIEKAVLVGHSMGGYVAFQFWKLYPDRINGLALVASRAKADSAARREERLKTAKEVEKLGTVVVVDGMLTKLTQREDLIPQLRPIMTRISPQGVTCALRAIANRADASEWLYQIDIPSLVVAGEEDQIVPLPEAIEMAEGMKYAELCVVKNAGHMPMMEEPAVTARALESLILRVNCQ